MKRAGFFVYDLLLALWVGGLSIFTFLVTPVIFRSFGRDLAGVIVGKLFPVYFPTLLALSVLTLLVLLVVAGAGPGLAERASVLLVVVAIAVNAYVLFRVYPQTLEVRARVTSFEAEPPDSPARREFSRLHGISAVLNLVVIADGFALLALSRGLRGRGAPRR